MCRCGQRGRRTGHWQRGGQSQKPNRKLNGRVGHTTTAISVPHAARVVVSSRSGGAVCCRLGQRDRERTAGRATRKHLKEEVTHTHTPDTNAAGYLVFFLFFFFSYSSLIVHANRVIITGHATATEMGQVSSNGGWRTRRWKKTHTQHRPRGQGKGDRDTKYAKVKHKSRRVREREKRNSGVEREKGGRRELCANDAPDGYRLAG